MFHVILFEPEIPPNAGNAIRLCANTGATLHLVRAARLPARRRPREARGLDYHEMSRVRRARDASRPASAPLGDARVFAVETTGAQCYDEVRYRAGRRVPVRARRRAGLPPEMLAGWPGERLIRLPMVPGNRSLNLSNAVAVVVFEAWRQVGFEGGR